MTVDGTHEMKYSVASDRYKTASTAPNTESEHAVDRRSTSVDSGNNFLDRHSSRALNWDDIWKQWQPVTVYGQDAKHQLHPFRPGDEEVWKQTLIVLRRDIEVINKAKAQTLQSQLRNMPDIRGFTGGMLRSTQSPTGSPQSGSPQSEAGWFFSRELLLLKQFAYYGKALSVNWASVLSGMWPAEKWDQLLDPFRRKHEPAFSIQHVASDDYTDGARKLAEVQRSLSQALQSWRESWRNETGVVPDKDGFIRCTLPQQRAVAHSLNQHPEAEWVQETPFESVFRIQKSDTLDALQHEQDKIRITMDEAAEEAKKRLGRKLQRIGALWQQAIEQIANLDLRISKVTLYLSWDKASVPQAAQRTAAKGAVHPLLANRLQVAGRSYIPLDWEVPGGAASVLCGSNMGGKTVAMSLLTICQLCTQYGLPVPAERFETRLFERVRFYAGAELGEDVKMGGAQIGASGLSSFGVEVLQVKDAWACLATEEPTLICFDEPVKSTNPIEGESLVVGLLRSFRKVLSKLNTRSTVIVATHFPQAATEPGLVQFRVRGLRHRELSHLAEASDEEISKRLQYLADAMDYRLERVETAEWSEEGLEVAAWIGLPEEILTESRGYYDNSRQL